MVEHYLAKVGVAGSNPVSRSSFLKMRPADLAKYLGESSPDFHLAICPPYDSPVGDIHANVCPITNASPLSAAANCMTDPKRVTAAASGSGQHDGGPSYRVRPTLLTVFLQRHSYQGPMGALGRPRPPRRSMMCADTRSGGGPDRGQIPRGQPQ